MGIKEHFKGKGINNKKFCSQMDHKIFVISKKFVSFK